MALEVEELRETGSPYHQRDVKSLGLVASAQWDVILRRRYLKPQDHCHDAKFRHVQRHA